MVLLIKVHEEIKRDAWRWKRSPKRIFDDSVILHQHEARCGALRSCFGRVDGSETDNLDYGNVGRRQVEVTPDRFSLKDQAWHKVRLTMTREERASKGANDDRNQAGF